MWLYFFVVYFCGIWAFSSSRKHLLITLLRLEFVVLVLYFSIYFYLCSFNYSLFRSQQLPARVKERCEKPPSQ